MLLPAIAFKSSTNFGPRAPFCFFRVCKPISGQADSHPGSLLFQQARSLLPGFSSGSAVVQDWFRMFMRFGLRVTLLLTRMRPQTWAAISHFRNLACFHWRAIWNCDCRQCLRAYLSSPVQLAGAFARAVNPPSRLGDLPDPSSLFQDSLAESGVAGGCSW